MAKSKFFSVFVEGDTADGREIKRQDILDMAATYSPKTYPARVWMEHFRSALPDSPFRAYGDVLALKAEEIEVPNIGKKLALFAQLDPTADLVEMNKQRQKLYSSVEVAPNFAKTGKAYLVGLSVTDTPASLGTEMMAFAAGAKESPFAGRKQDKDNLFTAAREFSLELEEEDVPSPVIEKGFLDKVKQFVSGKNKATDSDINNLGQAIEVIAESQGAVVDQFNALDKTIKANADASEKLVATVKSLEDKFSALEKKLEAEPGTPTRKPATGATGGAETDC